MRTEIRTVRLSHCGAYKFIQLGGKAVSSPVFSSALPVGDRVKAVYWNDDWCGLVSMDGKTKETHWR